MTSPTVSGKWSKKIPGDKTLALKGDASQPTHTRRRLGGTRRFDISLESFNERWSMENITVTIAGDIGNNKDFYCRASAAERLPHGSTCQEPFVLKKTQLHSHHIWTQKSAHARLPCVLFPIEYICKCAYTSKHIRTRTHGRACTNISIPRGQGH